MASRAKYIVGELPCGRLPVLSALVFPEHQEHVSMRAQFESIESAGFVSFGHNKEGAFLAQCHGRSVSLGVESNPERDSRLVNEMLGLLAVYL